MDKEWEQVPLGQLLSLEYGRALPEKHRDDSGFPVLGSAGIVGYHSVPAVKGPGIVIGRKGTAGSVTWVNDDFSPIDTTYWVRLLDESMTLDFAFLLLSAIDLPGVCAQTGVPGLNRDRAYELNASVPPLPVQHRIVDLMTHLDNHITSLKLERDSAEGVRTGLLQEIAQRALEEGSMRPLEEVLSAPLTYGVLKPGDYKDEGIPLIRGTDFEHHSIKTTQVQNISRELDAEYARSQVRTGDVLMILVGVPGAVALVPPELDGANISRAIGRLRCGPMLQPNFLLTLLASPWGQGILQEQVRGAVQQMINLKELRRLDLPIPTLAMQEELASQALAALGFVDSLDTEIRALVGFRSTLLTSLLSADIQVQETYESVVEVPA